jgi:FtsP/CotA-like multicopper oxidase with cupredoxin domain
VKPAESRTSLVSPASTRVRRLVAGAIAASLAGVAGLAQAGGDKLKDLPVLASSNGVLDLLMIAKAEPATLLTPVVPKQAMVYEICPRPKDGSEECPAEYDTPNLYGGTRLQLEQGDVLRIHLVNRLPPITDASHAAEVGMAWLSLSPTNLHTHGMLVAPRYPTHANPTYGDNVFVLTLNPDNGVPPPDSEFHSDVRLGSTDYEIRIPAAHPSGLFWFHPHVHGISSNQVTAGLSGTITIGKISDYACKGTRCASFLAKIPVRTMMLKDIQVLADGTIFSETDPAFCEQHEHQKDPPQGGCDGAPGTGYEGGRYYVTLNGQQYPTIAVGSPHGEIWRLTNASSNAIYNLQLSNAQNKSGIVMQVLSIDGVAVQPRKGQSRDQLLQTGGAKFDPVPCPGIGADAGARPAGTAAGMPLCVRRMVMMPASRVEVWVAYRDAAGNLAAPPAGTTASLRTVGHQTGEIGGAWTSIDIAKVEFAGTGPRPDDPRALSIADDARRLAEPTDLADELRKYNISVGAETKCAPLAAGHTRRIYLGRAGETLAFGMGYEEEDENDNPVPGSVQEVAPFNPDRPTICVPLGPGNTPVHERWEIVNIGDEDHSFHMHQVRFSVLARDRINGEIVPGTGNPGILHDSIPLKHGTGDCESIAAYHAGACQAYIQVIDVPFAVAGDFVYHCHVLEHEDGGMMARIRVRPNP